MRTPDCVEDGYHYNDPCTCPPPAELLQTSWTVKILGVLLLLASVIWS